MDIRRNADRLTLIYTATLSRFGSGPCIRRPTRPTAVQARSHLNTQLPNADTIDFFFFWSEKKGGSSAPSEPPLATCLPTPTVHAFFRCTRLVEHISPRSTTCLHKTELERKRTRSILQTSFFFERKNERERARERAPMTGESSRARFGWPLFIAECNLPSQSSTELEQKS